MRSWRDQLRGGGGPHTPGSLVLAALLVAVVVSRVAQPSRSDAGGALYSAGVAGTMNGEGADCYDSPGAGGGSTGCRTIL